MQIRDRIRELRRIPASELIPNPKNWRTHPQAQQDALRGVLAEVGYADALLGRETPAGVMLIDGHLRAETTPDQKVPVLILDVDEAEADKILATLDPLAALAEADAAKLDALLREVDTGSEAVMEMLADLAAEAGVVATDAEPVDAEPQIDRAAELQKEWGTEAGQVWEVQGKAGTHRVMCGDSTKAEDVGRLLNGAKPFIMVTDPPYGVEYDPEWRTKTEGLWTTGKAVASGAVDNDDRLDWTETYKLFAGTVAYVWHAGRFAADLVVNLRDAGFEIRTQIIWRKPRFIISRGHYHWQHEPCWYAVRKGRSSKWCGDHSQSTIWDIPLNRNTETGHSTQKPLECMARPIRNHGGKDDDVYDPFLGSGTTLIAAENLGRVCYGCEISAAYVAVILQRAKDAGMAPALTTLDT